MQSTILGEEDPRLRHILEENNYPAGTLIPGSHDYAVVCQFIYTGGILRGCILDGDMGYEERWCYHSLGAALAALAVWRGRDCVGEPEGWHRHLPSMRYRRNGDPATEEIRK